MLLDAVSPPKRPPLKTRLFNKLLHNSFVESSVSSQFSCSRLTTSTFQTTSRPFLPFAPLPPSVLNQQGENPPTLCLTPPLHTFSSPLLLLLVSHSASRVKTSICPSLLASVCHNRSVIHWSHGFETAFPPPPLLPPPPPPVAAAAALLHFIGRSV